MEPLPMACSLESGELWERYAELSELGVDTLIDSRSEGTTHRLSFKRSEDLEARLEAIIAAEARCCPFLDLSMTSRDSEVVLLISGPAEAAPVAAGLAAAFAGPFG
jgi:hypothetical protein